MTTTGVTLGTITRTLLLFLAIINQLLTARGMSPLPIDDVELAETIAFFFTAVTALIAWWKNNSFTKKAIEADKVLRNE